MNHTKCMKMERCKADNIINIASTMNWFYLSRSLSLDLWTILDFGSFRVSNYHTNYHWTMFSDPKLRNFHYRANNFCRSSCELQFHFHWESKNIEIFFLQHAALTVALSSVLIWSSNSHDWKKEDWKVPRRISGCAEKVSKVDNDTIASAAGYS